MRKVGILIRELSDDSDEGPESQDAHSSSILPDDLRAPWLTDFNGYLNSKDQLGNMTIVEWWGVSVAYISLLV